MTDTEKINNIVCKRCGYSTDRKSNLKNHLNKTQTCKARLQDISVQELLKQLDTKTQGKLETTTCEFCNARVTKANYSRHKLSCKDKPEEQPVLDITTLKQQLLEEITKKTKDEFNLQLQQYLQNNVDSSSKSITTQSETLDEIMSDSSESTSSGTEPSVIENNFNFTQEKFFQKVLESIYGGSHMKFDGGESDITTNEAHVEIKRWTCWKEIEGQLSAYNYFSNRDKLIACCFGPYQDYHKNIAYQVLTSKGIAVFDCQFCEKTRIFTYTNMTTNEKREILIMNV